MFSDLRSWSKPRNPLPSIDRFLSLYEEVVSATSIIDSLVIRRASEGERGLSGSQCSRQFKAIILWVEAALATNLEVVSLVGNQPEKLSPIQIPEKPTVSSPRASVSKRQSFSTPANKKNTAKVQSPPRSSSSAFDLASWSRGAGLRETAELASNLCQEMKIWFFKFLEEALEAGFRVAGESNGCEDGGNGQLAIVLSQLKRVNEWLDQVAKNRDDTVLIEMIESLKRKIYGFVIQHVGTVMVAPSGKV